MVPAGAFSSDRVSVDNDRSDENAFRSSTTAVRGSERLTNVATFSGRLAGSPAGTVGDI
jgi:hypothetical protein